MGPMIKVVGKAIAILGVFSVSEPRLTLAEITRRIDLPKSTTHNLLQTLLAMGFVERVADEKYALGTAIIPLTQAVRVNVELRDRAAPVLRKMADDARESAYLAIPDHGRCLYIYAVESSRRLLARTAVGEQAHMHCTSVGKSMLAYLPDNQVDEILGDAELEAFTPSTITDPAVLRASLCEIRARGYATDCQEHEFGTYCVGAPILDEQGRVLGACSLSGADPQMLGERLQDLAALVMHTAREISLRMGYLPARTGPNPLPVTEARVRTLERAHTMTEGSGDSRPADARRRASNPEHGDS